MTFEKHIRSVSRGASQRLGIFGSPGEYSMIYCFFGEAFWVFVLTVLELCSAALWCSFVDTQVN